MDNLPKPQTHNRADIDRQTYEGQQAHPAQARATDAIQSAGKVLAPWGFKYEGSAVVHYYSKPMTTDFVFGQQLIGMNGIAEGQADVGLKELRRALMGAYGRSDGRRKDTKEEVL